MSVARQSVEANYKLKNGVTFRSLSSNIQMERKQVEGGDSQAYQSLVGFELGPGMQTTSQEFNLISPEGNKVEWLVGLYRNNRHTELHLNIPLNAPCGWQYNSSWTPCPTALVPACLRSSWNSIDSVVHEAVYGQVNVHFTEKWTLMLEAARTRTTTSKTAATGCFGVTRRRRRTRCRARATSRGKSSTARSPVFRIRRARMDFATHREGQPSDVQDRRELGAGQGPVPVRVHGTRLQGGPVRSATGLRSPRSSSTTSRSAGKVRCAPGSMRSSVFSTCPTRTCSYSVFQTTAEAVNSRVVSNIGESSISGWRVLASRGGQVRHQRERRLHRLVARRDHDRRSGRSE